MPRTKGSPNKTPAKKRKNLLLSQEMITWLDRQPEGFTGTVEKLVREKMDEFGSVTFQGKTYRLTEQATLSNRVFPGWFGDAKEGEKYTVEYQAAAVDKHDNPYLVVWQFGDIRGEETEDESNYPWDDDHITQVRPQ